jgi:hypothetical protein
VSVGKIEKTVPSERIGLLGEMAGEHRPLPETITIHRMPRATTGNFRTHSAAQSSDEFLSPINKRKSRNAPRRRAFSRFPADGGDPMFDTETTALLRAVLDEVCQHVCRYETGARAHVASKLLEAATKGGGSVDDLKRVGQKALGSAPSMWR